jgi:hypothetical protein
MLNSSNSPAAAPGGSTHAPAAAAARHHRSATPASAGDFHPAPKPGRGATSSHRSPKSNTSAGKNDAPKREQPREVQLPLALSTCATWLYRAQAVEILVFDGGGRLIVGDTDAELQPGRYLLVQLADERDPLPANTIYRVPNNDQAE